MGRHTEKAHGNIPLNKHSDSRLAKGWVNGFISPSWYPSKHEHHQQVPTWNYQAAHVRGKIIIHDDKFYLHDQLTQLTKPCRKSPGK